MTPKHVAQRTLFAGTIATLAIVVVPTAWLAYAHHQSGAAASADRRGDAHADAKMPPPTHREIQDYAERHGEELKAIAKNARDRGFNAYVLE